MAGLVMLQGDRVAVAQDPPPLGQVVLPEASLLPTDDELDRVTIEPSLRELVASLRSPVWKTRNQATSELEDRRFGNQQLLAAMRQLDLDQEQRARLLAVLSRRILDAPSGAVGIRMSTGFAQQPGVRIEAVIEGMPAAGLLKAGDLIIRIDDKILMRSSDLTSIVQSKMPGDFIKVDVKRNRIDEDGEFMLDPNGQVLQEDVQVRFALGSIKQLNTDGGNVMRSSRVRSERAQRVRALIDRFASDPVLVRLSASTTDESQAITAPVGNHPAMAWISSISAAIDQGVLKVEPSLREHIDHRLGLLEMEVADPDLPPEERAWLQRVVEAYSAAAKDIQ